MAKRQPGAAMVAASRDIWTVKRMNAMRNEPLANLRRTLLVCVCGALLALPAATAKADDDDDTFEQKIIKNILGGMGVDVGRPGIDYRERSPLVIPPTRDLPPPQAADVSARNPAWPREPDKKVVVRTKPNVRSNPNEPGTESVMSPDEMRRGASQRASRVTETSRSGSIDEANTARGTVSPNELSGTYSIFSWRSLMGVHLNEQATFSGEPTRGSLTQPPPGYQTPSSAQPYGLGTEKGSGWKIPTILDRPVGNDQ
jgi:hypothetical protein